MFGAAIIQLHVRFDSLGVIERFLCALGTVVGVYVCDTTIIPLSSTTFDVNMSGHRAYPPRDVTFGCDWSAPHLPPPTHMSFCGFEDPASKSFNVAGNYTELCPFGSNHFFLTNSSSPHQLANFESSYARTIAWDIIPCPSQFHYSDLTSFSFNLAGRVV
ncbi:hypothetical protein BDN72DRAFT_526399 [Pluteus cervinus]|uniref:Uncharacterized protein n=1 Tax=Pluteus cervinus TaxID=181527 RepID=A0ACD3A4W7_9AGAR|nr:hypothetical protein BDN72DRAFT_526399 [Pluteus cervinus]